MRTQGEDPGDEEEREFLISARWLWEQANASNQHFRKELRAHYVVDGEEVWLVVRVSGWVVIFVEALFAIGFRFLGFVAAVFVVGFRFLGCVAVLLVVRFSFQDFVAAFFVVGFRVLVFVRALLRGYEMKRVFRVPSGFSEIQR